MPLVQCSDGKMAPGCVVCRHLADGLSSEWIEIPMEGEEVSDYLCPECIEKGPEGIPESDLRSFCMHCARKAMEASGA
jgi:hypothetical protein